MWNYLNGFSTEHNIKILIIGRELYINGTPEFITYFKLATTGSVK